MAKYKMQVFCKQCSEVHPTFVFELSEQIEPNQSVADAYRGRELPPIISVILSNRLTCPNTGGNYGDDTSQAFLVKLSPPDAKD